MAQLNDWATYAYDPPGTFWVELTLEQVYALNPVTVVRPFFTRVEQLKYGLRKPGQPPQ